MYKFDIMDETWIDTLMENNDNQLDYGKIPGYVSIFENHSDKREVEAGFCIIETIPFTGRNDSMKNDNPMEVLLIQIYEENKKLAVTNQTSSIDSNKCSWSDSFESLLSEVSTKWNDVIFVTGDRNIDLIGELRESKNRHNLYTYILSSYCEHVTMALEKVNL